MPNEVKLLPCPFCNSQPEIMEGHRNHWRVECPRCGVRRAQFANGGIEEDKARAVRSWNHRPTTLVTDEPLKLEWRDGAPGNPWAGEWFIALTTYGDRVVLKALPEEFAYDFKTADDTYIMRDKIAKWMQFPDSEYIAPVAIVTDEVVEPAGILAEVREQLATLADKQADQRGDYLYRGQPDAWLLEAIRKLDAAIASMPTVVTGEQSA